MKENWLKPDWQPGLSISSLPINHLLQIGIKSLVLDVDGTLLPRNELNVHSSVLIWIKEAQHYFNLHLLSNNPSRERINFISKTVEIAFTYKAAKPSRRALQKVLIKLQNEPNQIAMIGDRLFTDIIAGNRLGLYTILVKPLASNGITCKHNRTQRFEQRIASFFEATK